MAGDINLFLDSEDNTCGEVSIMVAEKESLRKGIAQEVQIPFFQVIKTF